MRYKTWTSSAWRTVAVGTARRGTVIVTWDGNPPWTDCCWGRAFLTWCTLKCTIDSTQVRFWWCNPPLQPMSLCKMTSFPVLRHLHNSMTRRQSADLHTQHLLLQQLILKYCFTIQSIIAPQFYCTLQKLSVVGFWLILRLASLWVSWNGHFPLMILEIRDFFLSSNWKWATTETSCLPADRT